MIFCDTEIIKKKSFVLDAVAEEVVIDPSGGSGEAVDCYQRQQEAIVEGEIG